ncbi:BREX-4 system phosphatase PglZ [Dysgonomonas sp. ZJ709]|uniref:BREX-4 system phosphatase PglZ n=1 Tax=Dysgonomonas sp. ZJ709 TaxID=2709797 RepID=UPI0013ED08BC|nr:BREX-4 system phosphatase PglZ [Dysgonomonas sp. ZJ709]
MTAAEKIKTFASIDDLLEEIRNDNNSNSVLNRRYAVRFIMLDNFNLYQDFIRKMTKCEIQVFNLEQLLDSDDRDSWITTDMLVNAIKDLKGQVVVSPFSEIVRFYKDGKFKALFEGMTLMELDISTRIYIPLIGLKHRFENFLNTFSRIQESQPIWAVYSEELQTVEIDLIPNNFPCINSLNCLKNVYEWLVFWKTHAPTERILCSSDTISTFSKYSQPDNIFDIRKIETAYSFITQFLNIQTGIEYKVSDEVFWIQLLSLLDYHKTNSFSFKVFVNKYFNIHDLKIENLLNIWTSNETKEFDRWLLKHYYLHFLADNKYLNEIIIDCVDYSSLRLFREIALTIFVDTSTKKFIEERNNLLNLFDRQYKLPDSDLSEMKEQILNIAKLDTAKAISLCSSRFDFEKEMFIDWYKDGKLKDVELQKLYPDFAAYQYNINYGSWVNTYIQSYKRAKIEDKYTDEIKNFITEKNANEETFYQWYHSFELSKELLSKEQPDKVYWVDGLGVEYLSLIKEIISNSNFEIEKLQIAITSIPSSTEHNKFKDVEKIEDLDSFIHNNLYQYPQTICKEIDIVKNIFKKILNQTTEITLAIVSDHGLTALSRLVDSKKYTVKASHEGRYIKLDSTDCLEDSDYIRCKNREDNFKVALTHASLNTKPVREVHGGCTPEEILVPFIIISNKKENIKNISKQNIPEQIASKQVVGFEEEELF